MTDGPRKVPGKSPASKAAVAGMAAAWVGVLSWAVGCYGATELVLDVTTDHSCVAEALDGGAGGGGQVVTAIKVGAVGETDDPVTELAQCTTRPQKAANIGTLVVVPSDARDARVSIKVMMTTNGAPTRECAGAKVPGYCIVARRSAAFIEHTSLRIPIHLYDGCRGVTCEGETTCGKAGTCVSSIVDSDGCTAADTDCKTGKEPGVDAASPDAGATDAGLTDVDAANVCVVPKADNALAVVPRFANQGFDGDDRTLLAANTTHVFWTEPGATNTALVKRMAKSGAGVPELLGTLPTPVRALAANDTHWWAASSGGVSQGRLDGGATIDLTPARSDIGAIGLDAVSPAVPYFTTKTVDPLGAVFTVTDGATMDVLGKSVGGALIAVSSSALFTASGTLLRLHPLPYLTSSKILEVPVGLASGLAADGAIAYVSEVDRRRVTSYDGKVGTSVALVATPGAVAVDGVDLFVLDHGSANGGTDTFASSVRRGAMIARGVAIPRITPLYTRVNGLVIDRAPNGCVYFLAEDSGENKLLVYPKRAPPL